MFLFISWGGGNQHLQHLNTSFNGFHSLCSLRLSKKSYTCFNGSSLHNTLDLQAHIPQCTFSCFYQSFQIRLKNDEEQNKYLRLTALVLFVLPLKWKLFKTVSPDFFTKHPEIRPPWKKFNGIQKSCCDWNIPANWCGQSPILIIFSLSCIIIIKDVYI